MSNLIKTFEITLRLHVLVLTSVVAKIVRWNFKNYKIHTSNAPMFSKCSVLEIILNNSYIFKNSNFYLMAKNSH